MIRWDEEGTRNGGGEMNTYWPCTRPMVGSNSGRHEVHRYYFCNRTDFV